MASNYNINDMVGHLNQYTQQQNVPQYQVTPEQLQAYKDMFALKQQQLKDREALAQQMQQAAQKDAKMGMATNMLGAIANGVGNRGEGTNSIDLVFRDYRGNVIGQLQGDRPQPARTPVAPQNVNTNAVKQQLALQEQQQAQQLANAQEMAKFQEAIALANQYNIPIGQAMGLTGKDILSYEQSKQTGQSGIQKEAIGSIGDLYKTELQGQQAYQLEGFKASNDLNLQQNKYLNEGLLQIQKGNIDKGIEEMKQAGLNKRQEAELLNRMNIARTQANATMNAAATRAAATRYAADQRVQGQPSFGPVSAGMTNYMFYPEDVQRQIINDYNAYARMSGLRRDEPQPIQVQQLPVQQQTNNANFFQQFLNRGQDAGW